MGWRKKREVRSRAEVSPAVLLLTATTAIHSITDCECRLPASSSFSRSFPSAFCSQQQPFPRSYSRQPLLQLTAVRIELQFSQKEENKEESEEQVFRRRASVHSANERRETTKPEPQSKRTDGRNGIGGEGMEKGNVRLIPSSSNSSIRSPAARQLSLVSFPSF